RSRSALNERRLSLDKTGPARAVGQVVGPYTSGVPAAVAEPNGRLLAVGEHPGDPVRLVEPAVQTDGPVTRDVAAARPFPAAVAGRPFDFGPERQDALLEEAPRSALEAGPGVGPRLEIGEQAGDAVQSALHEPRLAGVAGR